MVLVHFLFLHACLRIMLGVVPLFVSVPLHAGGPDDIEWNGGTPFQ